MVFFYPSNFVNIVTITMMNLVRPGQLQYSGFKTKKPNKTNLLLGFKTKNLLFFS